MRSAAQFLLLLAAGVFIVSIYQRSGDSLPVLIMALLTVVALAALSVLRPWELAAERNEARKNDPPSDVQSELAEKRIKTRSSPNAEHITRQGPAAKIPIWRAKFGVSYNEQELVGVPVGKGRSQTWPWAKIEAIGSDWCEEMVGTKVVAKRGLRLDLRPSPSPDAATSAMLALGPRQILEETIAESQANWRSWKVPRSPYYELDPEERTRTLIADLGFDDGVQDVLALQGADVAYQQGIRSLLRTGLLCRLSDDCQTSELLQAFQNLLTKRGLTPLSQDEANDILDGAPAPDPVASGYELIDWLAQLRACRAVFVDHGGHDYLIGLLSAESADHWDGQIIGDNAAQVLLGLPSSGEHSPAS